MCGRVEDTRSEQGFEGGADHRAVLGVRFAFEVEGKGKGNQFLGREWEAPLEQYKHILG